MNKFHQIPTDQFVPISHDNSYLFTHYDKVANFLAFNLDKNYKNILAKPVQNGYAFDWFSGFEGLVNINEYNKVETDAGLIKYWQFIELINVKIEQLSNSFHDDEKNWASLLTKVFNHQDNFIFSNGKEISIVWGWKFDNNQIYKPDLRSQNEVSESQGSIIDTVSPLNHENTTGEDSPLAAEDIPVEKNIAEENPEKFPDLPTEEEDRLLEQPRPKYDFLEFLKWFAAKFWWLLWVLTFLVAIVFIIKAYNVNS